MKKIMFVLLVICLSVSVAFVDSHAAKNDAPKKKDGFVIAFSNSFITHTWRTQMLNNFQKDVLYYKGKGLIKKIYVQHAGFNLNLQISQIRNFINLGVDAIISDPISATALNPIFEQAVKAGILVVITDEPVSSKKVYQVIPSHTLWQEKLSRYVFNRMGGKGNIIYLSGIEGAPASIMRDAGFKRALKDYPNIKMMTKAYGWWDSARAQQTMSDVLAAYPNIDGVVSQDCQVLAVIRAFQAANKPIPIINGSGDRPFLEFWVENLDKGFTSFAIANGPGFAITGSVGVAVRLLQGKKIKPELLDGKILYIAHTNVITDKNVKSELEEHVQFRGVEDYIDEVWTQDRLDRLFIK